MEVSYNLSLRPIYWPHAPFASPPYHARNHQCTMAMPRDVPLGRKCPGPWRDGRMTAWWLGFWNRDRSEISLMGNTTDMTNITVIYYYYRNLRHPLSDAEQHKRCGSEKKNWPQFLLTHRLLGGSLSAPTFVWRIFILKLFENEHVWNHQPSASERNHIQLVSEVLC